METVSDLISSGILSYASQPPGNPHQLEFSSYVLPLIEHDYPARTPLLWNAAYREFGMTAGCCMLTGSPAAIERILRAFRRDPKYRGGGMGIGFKEVAFHHLYERDSLVNHLHAVNLLVKTSNGSLRGYNTDGVGYAQSLREVFEATGRSLAGTQILLLGAGGTSSAVAFALADAGCVITIANRTLARAEELAARLNLVLSRPVARAIADFQTAEYAAQPDAMFDAIVNVSSVGAAGALAGYSPLAAVTLPPTEDHISQNQQAAEKVLDRISRTAILSDVVIAPGGTPFLRLAAARGFTTLDGIPMVVNQAVESFWIMQGSELATAGISKSEVGRVMKRALE